MVLLAFQANKRPTTCQRLDLITVFEGINNLDFSNLAVVFTFCDTMDMTSKAEGWLQHLIKTTNLEDYP